MAFSSRDLPGNELRKIIRGESEIRWTYLLTINPMRVPGATGGPVNPIAHSEESRLDANSLTHDIGRYKSTIRNHTL